MSGRTRRSVASTASIRVATDHALNVARATPRTISAFLNRTARQTPGPSEQPPQRLAGLAGRTAMFGPRDDARDRDGREEGRERLYDERERGDDPRQGVMRDLDLPRGESANWSRSVPLSKSWTARTAARWPPWEPSGSRPSTTSTSTTTRSTTCATRASSRQSISATTTGASRSRAKGSIARSPVPCAARTAASSLPASLPAGSPRRRAWDRSAGAAVPRPLQAAPRGDRPSRQPEPATPDPRPHGRARDDPRRHPGRPALLVLEPGG